MEENNRKVLIDADFFRHTTENEIGTELFELILEEFGYVPVMHGYVANVELKGFKEKIAKLIDKDKLEIISEKNYIDETNIEEYREYFSQAYENHRAYPCRRI